MICQFCNKEFSTKITLYQHQQKAKYCLTLQGVTNSNYQCDYCEKILSTHERLITHINACKIKQKKDEIDKENAITFEYKNNIKELQNEILNYQDKLQEKNDYIAKLEAKLEKLETTVTTIALEAKTPAKAASSTTNNTTNLITVTNNNYLNLSQEHIKKVLSEKLNYNVVYAGQAGLAKFVFDYMLTDEDGNVIYRCVDPSRQTFEFIDEKGEKVRDVKAEKLIQSLLKGDVIRYGLEEAAKGWNTDDNSLNLERTTVFGPKVSEYAELNRNNTVFRSKVSSLTA
jgi:D-lyxose ketol-isomerase